MNVRATLLCVAIALVGCKAAPPTVPSSMPGIIGHITAVDRGGERIGAIRVEARPADTTGSDKAVAAIEASTEVLTAQRVRTDFNAFRVGQPVRVWFTGPVMESYPVRGTAATVVIDTIIP